MQQPSFKSLRVHALRLEKAVADEENVVRQLVFKFGYLVASGMDPNEDKVLVHTRWRNPKGAAGS